MAGERILFVTGRLAEYALRSVVEPLAASIGFEFEIDVLGISVAALMHADWVERKIEVRSGFDRVILPGWCQGNTQPLSEKFNAKIEVGPKDVYDLAEFFGRQHRPAPDLDQYDIEILAEINHAPRLEDSEILRIAEAYRRDGADVIDVGCVPGESWSRAGDVTRMLCREGFRVSIDSFDQTEVEAAVANGAELVLSCNASNIEWVEKLNAELVVIPDDIHVLDTLQVTIDRLNESNVRYRIDPVLEPIGFGFSASLGRYIEARGRWPDLEMMFGIGNLTELSEVDSAGVNFVLSGFCQELGIRSVLTTEVINWTRTAVREIDLARRLMHYSVNQWVLPKHLDSSLTMLRDGKLNEYGEEGLNRLASQLKDPNFRIFVERGTIYVMNRDGCWNDSDPYELFDTVVSQTEDIDSSHAFYLGYELSKAVTALTLGKQYTQDEPLNWGFLTRSEISATERRKHGHRN